MTANKKSAPPLDFRKAYKALYSPSAKEPVIVDVPDFKCLMIDGHGDPNGAEFSAKIAVLYGIAYTLKFSLKKDPSGPFEFSLAPLSGLWRAADPRAFFEQARRSEWRWTLMIPMPDVITPALLRQASAELKRKKDPDFLDQARLEVYREGLAAQVMHLGPYSAEPPTISRLHAFFQEKGYTFNGPHHEIYLSDPKRTAPEKMRTIIRQPVKKA